MHMPPPVHGAAVVGQQIYESKIIRESFKCSYINVSTSASLDDVGRFSFAKITKTFAFYRRVLNAVKDERPDVVYFTPSTSGWAFYRDAITIRLLRRRRQNVVIHLHNKPTDVFLHKWCNQWVWRRFFQGVSAIFLGEALAKQFDKFTPLCRNIYICPNGMPDKVGNTAPMQKAPKEGRAYTFLFLSNMIESKGVYVLLEACAMLKQKGYDFRCEFVGQWFDVTKDGFEVKCAQLNVSDCVSAYGAQYGAEKDAFLQKADALIFPTFYPAETFGLVLLEAMQYSLPIISTSEAAIPSIVENGKTGWLVEKCDAHALSDKMEWLLKHTDEGKRMGRSGRMKYEREYMLPVFEERLSNILMLEIE